MIYFDWQTLIQHVVGALLGLGGIAAAAYLVGRFYEHGKIHAHAHAQNVVNNAIQQGRNIEKAEEWKRTHPGQNPNDMKGGEDNG